MTHASFSFSRLFTIIFTHFLLRIFIDETAQHIRLARDMDFDMDLREIKISPADEARLNQKLRFAFRRKYKSDDPNFFDAKENKTIFEKVLRTPESEDDIKWCIKNGADLYTVSLCCNLSSIEVLMF